MTRPWDDEERCCFGYVMAEVRKWQEAGRSGYNMPVLRGELLERLEKLADNWTREHCTCCDGTGKCTDGYDKWDCVACEPKHPSNVDA